MYRETCSDLFWLAVRDTIYEDINYVIRARAGLNLQGPIVSLGILSSYYYSSATLTAVLED